MADNQKIHPVPDVERPPTAPLIPPSTVKSDRAEPPAHYQQYPPPAPPARTVPQYYSPPPKSSKRSRCCRCCCCLICLLFFLIVVVGILIGLFFLIFHPKIPHYSIDGLKVTQFQLGNDNSLSATFDVNITAENPNKHVGIYYEDGSHLSVWYDDTELCEGSLPVFYQGHKNTTVMTVALNGETTNATGLVTELQTVQQNTGGIPLDIRGKVPVKLKVGKLKLFKITFKVSCSLTVDSVNANDQISITRSSCKIRFHL